MQINVIVKNRVVELSETKTFLELSKDYQDYFDYPIIIAKADGELTDLNKSIVSDCKVEFLDISDNYGYLAYQRGVSFMLYYAVKKLYGKRARLVIRHSVSKNFYCTIDDMEITPKHLKEIKKVMLGLVESDAKIERKLLRIDTARTLAESYNSEDRKRMLRYRRGANIHYNKIEDVYNYYLDVLPSSCGMLKVFDLQMAEHGFVLVFPPRKTPNKLKAVQDYSKILSVFDESEKWGKILGVNDVGELNDIISGDGIAEFIRVNEALQEKKIASIADDITNGNKKVVLIAGPSSSGKTTFAKRLCIHLRVNGLIPHVISLDDYYKNRSDIPFEANGRQDFESINSLEVEMINRDLKDLVDGKEVEIPHFNFVTGVKEYKGRKLQLEENEVVVVEGIHGLNDKLTKYISHSNKYKIFISALTQLNVDDSNRISTRDTRLLRRIVRDHLYRGFSATTTLAMWPDVLQGEIDNIFPYQEEADAIFNSALVYELSVLKNYVEPILFKVDSDSSEITEVKRLIKFLDVFLGVTSEYVPSLSLLREFIGGSCFE